MMCGSAVFKLVGAHFKVSWIILTACSMSTVALGSIALGINHKHSLGLAVIVFLCFLIFEFSTGMFLPGIATLKSELIPDKVRATAYAIFRVPQSAIVLV